MSMNHVEEFMRVLEAAGMLPAEIIPNGAIYRCPTARKPKSKDGAYCMFADGLGGWYQPWGESDPIVWQTQGQEKMSSVEKKVFCERVEAAKRKRQEDQAKRYHETAAKAQAMLQSLAKATADTPYLKAKGVAPTGDLRVTDDSCLVVPVLGIDGKLQSLQFIPKDGGKRFLSGGKITGGYFPIKGNDGLLYIVEGAATGLSVHEATGLTVLCAFNAGNLKAVTEMARGMYPKREIIIAGDNDQQTDGNPGRTKAKGAAQAVGGKWIIPLFEDKPDLSDFNDLHQLAGLDAVRTRLAQAEAPSQVGVPRGFSLKKDGVYFLEEDKDGVPFSVKVCSPLYVVALTRNGENEAWGRLLRFTDPEAREKEWAMPMLMLAGRGDEYRRELLSKGLRIEPGGKAQNRLHSYLSSSNPQAYARCVPRVGWHGGQFVFPDEVYGSAHGEQVILQTAFQRNPFTSQGTLSEWKDNVASLCAGNCRLAFAVSTALAAPLLEVVGQESGGVHFVGGSSTGKTTVLRLAGTTAGGGGINGFIEQWRATDNGLESTAAMHCDCPLMLDEVGQASGKVAGEVAYMLANGQGKTRASRSGGGRPSLQWRILFLSTGEITLSDKIKEDKFSRAMAGQAVRMVDIPIDAGQGLGAFENLHGLPDGDSFARRLKEVSGRYYGTALREMVKRIAEDRDGVAERVNAGIKQFIADNCPTGSDGQVQRVASRFGLAALAGGLASTWGIVPWNAYESHKAASACFSAWLDARGGIGSIELQEGLALVRSFIQQHGASRFENLDAETEQRIINRAGYRQRVDGELRYCIPPEAFRREVCPGHDTKAILKELDRLGLLFRESGRWTRNVRTMDGLQKLHVISSSVLTKPSGNTGNSGNKPGITGENLFPVNREQLGTLGTEGEKLSPVPTCSQYENTKWEQESASNISRVPSVPTVPSKKSENTNGKAEAEEAYKRGTVTI